MCLKQQARCCAAPPLASSEGGTSMGVLLLRASHVAAAACGGLGRAAGSRPPSCRPLCNSKQGCLCTALTAGAATPPLEPLAVGRGGPARESTRLGRGWRQCSAPSRATAGCSNMPLAAWLLACLPVPLYDTPRPGAHPLSPSNNPMQGALAHPHVKRSGSRRRQELPEIRGNHERIRGIVVA